MADGKDGLEKHKELITVSKHFSFINFSIRSLFHR